MAGRYSSSASAVKACIRRRLRRRKRLLMQAFTADALEEYLPAIEQVIDRYASRWAGLGQFAWVPELNAMGFAIAASLFTGADPKAGDPRIEAAFDRFAA